MKPVYDPTDVIAVVGAVEMEGFSANEFINASRQEDSTNIYIGNSGEGTYSKNPNQSGVITMTFKHDSNSLSVLSALSLKGVPPFPILISDSSSLLAKCVGTNCMIKKIPDFVRAKEVSEIPVEIFCEKLITFG